MALTQVRPEVPAVLPAATHTETFVPFLSLSFSETDVAVVVRLVFTFLRRGLVPLI